ncbi:MAG: dicarboxylate/amino acid:cation symporter [Nitrospina sp.]|jgi:solute carrier family 1 (neuronal/epithelial high affinity glutamate transporter), member 1|nr:dicarboxylate/amino acid:cation symporter [Nitrospina sp.]MBT3510212.1 dicarboxylate/amino acid:cation symporter [Nitrospina sp.]MBT3876820.1 dicarboxylate/amino acid:cation symporter [Nitrospina sp.]MBT4048176.1 dicarboxylate/amino acid:cation symporter [Nitrospina sp.]MBT4556862.1 dicarboxylate/amino acid:cation symporter [Nitrospina sp.]
MKKNGLLFLMIAGIFLGIFSGWMFGKTMLVVAWIGEMFLDALKMLVVPLIISSMIVGIAGLGDIRKVGKTGLIALGYFMITTCIAVGIGLVMVNIIEPGVAVEMTVEKVPEKVMGKEAVGITDILKSFVSPNLVESMVKMEILPLIVFSLVFGAVLTTLGEPGKRAIDFFDTVNSAVMKIVHLLMYFAPIGVFALIASKLGAAGGGDLFLVELAKIGKYVGTVISALLIHGLVVLPTILFMTTRKNPLIYFKNVTPALTTAFSTASSSATLPITIECAEENNKVSRKASLFVLPLAATVNMNGTALYESVAALFIAQMLGIQLGFGEQMIVFLTATLAAIGAAGIPEAGLVTMVMVLQSVGLPLEGIGMLLSMDWFLDRCRTTINVWGDSIGAGVVDKLEEDWVERGGKT